MNLPSEELIKLIKEATIKVLSEKEKVLIPVGVSNRHVHLNREDLDILFGIGYSLNKLKDLKQPGQYATKETVTIKGSKGEIEHVRILGPLRKETQVEISLTDGFKLGLNPPIRESGKLENSSPITIIGPVGSIKKTYGAIVAYRHIHMPEYVANILKLKDKDIVSVNVDGIREAILGNVLVRVSKDYELEMHLDLDEANALNIKNNDTVTIVDKVIK